MAMRLFLVYAVVELAVLVALASAIGFGWTVLLFVGMFLVGLALAGSQLRRHLRRLQSGLTIANAQGAVTDSVLVALGTVLVVIPGLASSVVGALLLLPPTRAVARPLVTAMAARRVPLIVGVGTVGSAAAGARSGSASQSGYAPWSGYAPQSGYVPQPGRGDYIDGEVIDIDGDVVNVQQPRLSE